MSSTSLERLSVEDLQAECGAVLPTKEVLSVPLLDLNADINLALDLAAPIDLAVAGNVNAALPINAAVSANALSALSAAEAGGSQGVALDQFISGHAVAHGDQTSGSTRRAAVPPPRSGASVAALGPAIDHHAGTTRGDADDGCRPAWRTPTATPSSPHRRRRTDCDAARHGCDAACRHGRGAAGRRHRSARADAARAGRRR